LQKGRESGNIERAMFRFKGFDRDPGKHDVLSGTYLLDSDRGEKIQNFCSCCMTVELLIFLKNDLNISLNLPSSISNNVLYSYSRLVKVIMGIEDKGTHGKQNTKSFVKLECDEYRKIISYQVLSTEY
jgi:hypothetical protein